MFTQSLNLQKSQTFFSDVSEAIDVGLEPVIKNSTFLKKRKAKIIIDPTSFRTSMTVAVKALKKAHKIPIGHLVCRF